MTFENGMTISVQWGLGNYCSRKYEEGKTFGDEMKEMNWTSTNAEIAVWDKNNTWMIHKGGDTVRGWVSPNEVLEVMNKVAKAKTIEELHEDVSIWEQMAEEDED